MFTFNHFNFNVLDLNKSMEFYSKALGLKEVRRKDSHTNGNGAIGSQLDETSAKIVNKKSISTNANIPDFPFLIVYISPSVYQQIN